MVEHSQVGGFRRCTSRLESRYEVAFAADSAGADTRFCALASCAAVV